MEARECPDCGSTLPPDAPRGFCPRCLIKMGLESQHPTASSDAAGPASDDGRDALCSDDTLSVPPRADASRPVVPASDDPPPAAHPEAVGPYRVLEVLGEGGMGVVYLAEQTEPVRRRVALKLIKLGMDTKEVVARFESERQALALMTHSSIAKIFDAGSSDSGRPYFVMEYVAGEPITDYCDHQRLSTKARLKLFMQVCDAVHHAHQKAIIHRDLKPSNVLVALEDGKPVPKIIDFGVAKAINQRLSERTVYTERGQIIGTLEYMSPEQAEASVVDIDTRTDAEVCPTSASSILR